MTVTFVGADTGGGNTTSITDLNWPGSLQAADFAVLGWCLSSGVSNTVPDGFTLISNQTGDSGTMQGRFYGRVLDGSETGQITNLDTGATNRNVVGLAVYRGLHATTPADAWSTTWGDESNSSATSHASPSATPNFADCVAVTMGIERATSGSTSLTHPSGYTERCDTLLIGNGTGGTILAIADDGLAAGRPASTPVTPPNWQSGSAFATANFMTFTIMLRPPLVAASSDTPGNRINNRKRRALVTR